MRLQGRPSIDDSSSESLAERDRELRENDMNSVGRRHLVIGLAAATVAASIVVLTLAAVNCFSLCFGGDFAISSNAATTNAVVIFAALAFLGIDWMHVHARTRNVERPTEATSRRRADRA